MPIWMRVDAEGIQIVDVRDERAAVHMAHAHAELTGEIGVALVTAGPGLTNAITGIANAHIARAPVLVLSGVPPRCQENRGSLQDIDHTQLVRSITRYAKTVREPALVLQELDAALDKAFGNGGDPGPAYLDFPTDTLRAEVPSAVQLEEHFRPKMQAVIRPDPDAVSRAVELLWSAKRPLVISGRGVRHAGKPLIDFLGCLGAAYLDTAESRGLVPDHHPSIVNAMRGKVMSQADVVMTIGRRLDFQLAYGSPAVFGSALFLRIADAPSELRDNRRGVVEIMASPAAALEAIMCVADKREPAIDVDWVKLLHAQHEDRTLKYRKTMRSTPADSAGRMHPNRLLAAIQEKIDDDSVLVTDGGDFLSFGRIGLTARKCLDPGSFGCIGVGVPFGIAASLAYRNRKVIVATGDGAFGFNAIEIDTAVRHRAPVVIVIANNGAWQIEVHDQKISFNRVIGTELRFSDYAAMAKGLGMYAERIESPDDLHSALDRAFANAPALLDVVVSPEAISSDGASGLAQVPDLQALTAWDDAEHRWRATEVKNFRPPID